MFHRQWEDLNTVLGCSNKQVDKSAASPVNGCKECLDLVLTVRIAEQESSTVTGHTVKTAAHYTCLNQMVH